MYKLKDKISVLLGDNILDLECKSINQRISGDTEIVDYCFSQNIADAENKFKGKWFLSYTTERKYQKEEDLIDECKQ